MLFSRDGGRGCGTLVARVVLVVMLAITAFASRSWFEGKALDAIYGNRPRIHAGDHFEPGATAVEDGVRQTAVLIRDVPHVRVTSPTPEWRRNHKDAKCDDGVCTARATHEKYLGGIDLMSVLAGLLVCYLVWILLVDTGRPSYRDEDDHRPYARDRSYDRYRR
ncbi:hypothetical protein GCM10023085_65570 [Actinomadura viridis]|uniref:Uncharacterized protein n=1 Tax=Actinomadura viridis TaxID=58110 RepID=A0A931DQR7_9ACTN|nr:hypothetical protein [Actinomadura viridis]MBG6093028.1 hypothetical protein [Actinomadura viridis]